MNKLRRTDSGGKQTPVYRKWSSMLRRCRDVRHPAYGYYGGRGIVVCERWKVFENFVEDMGEPPEGMWLDRINNDGNYEPSNCKWATPKDQAANRRKRPQVEGSIRQRARVAGISYVQVIQRIHRGWTLEQALSIPIQKVGAITHAKRLSMGLNV